MRRRSIAALLLAACLATSARADVFPFGEEFQANTYTANVQSGPAVATLAGGGFVVTWSSYGGATDPSGHSVQGQRYDATGAPDGPQFQVNVWTTNSQTLPAVAADTGGGFIVVWTSNGGSGTDTDAYSIQGRRYDATGTPLGPEFQVNSYTTSFQGNPAIAVDAAGASVVVWMGFGSDDSDTDSGSVHGQRYDVAGLADGGEFQVNSYTTGVQGVPAIAADASGSFVVVWYSEGSAGTDTSYNSIQGQRYDAAGAPDGGEFQVNSYTTGYQLTPDVAATGSGTFVVVWHSDEADGDASAYSVHGQRYDAMGAPDGGEFQLNTYVTGNQAEPVVAAHAAGGFVVVWQSQGSSGPDVGSTSIQGRRYDAAGTPLGPEFQVNSYSSGTQAVPAVATDGAGGFVAAWASQGSPGSDNDNSYGIVAQRFAPGRRVRGKKILVKDPTGAEEQRTVIALGKETGTDIGPGIVGNPVFDGATLRVIAKGTLDSDQTYVLDAAGWSPVGTTGFKYSGPTAGDGDPVKKLLLKRTPNGTALVKAILKGNVGTQSLDVEPPNAGDEGGLILGINGGATYCVAFGGAAGGSEAKDTDQLWKITNATADACPSP
jgi:hypothetical protein